MKTSLTAKLQRIRYYGGLQLDDFKDLLTEEEFNTCLKVKKSRPTWFPLTIDVFISFLYRVSHSIQFMILTILSHKGMVLV